MVKSNAFCQSERVCLSNIPLYPWPYRVFLMSDAACFLFCFVLSCCYLRFWSDFTGLWSSVCSAREIQECTGVFFAMIDTVVPDISASKHYTFPGAPADILPSEKRDVQKVPASLYVLACFAFLALRVSSVPVLSYRIACLCSVFGKCKCLAFGTSPRDCVHAILL